MPQVKLISWRSPSSSLRIIIGQCGRLALRCYGYVGPVTMHRCKSSSGSTSPLIDQHAGRHILPSVRECRVHGARPARALPRCPRDGCIRRAQVHQAADLHGAAEFVGVVRRCGADAGGIQPAPEIAKAHIANACGTCQLKLACRSFAGAHTLPIALSILFSRSC